MDVFADTLYWIAVSRPGDPWAAAAQTARSAIPNARLITTEEVLSEFLTALSRGGPAIRTAAVQLVRAIMNSAEVHVVAQSHESFSEGLENYAARADKSYSLVDCISMQTMRRLGIQYALTNDHHFAQDGFSVLIPSRSD
jgi:predicted nucleic acid-binding protein